MEYLDLASEKVSARYVVMRDGNRAVLATGSVGGRWPGQTLLRGQVTVCYGLPILLEQDYLVPQSLVDDFRREYHGAEALKFVLDLGAAFPRADISGVRVSSRTNETLFLKQVDLGRPVAAYVYDTQQADSPFRQIDATVWVGDVEMGLERVGDEDQRFPVLLRRVLPCFALDSSKIPEIAGLLDIALA